MSQPSHPLTAIRRLGTVNSFSWGPPAMVNVSIGGDVTNTTNTVDLPYLDSYIPTVGDIVLILTSLGDPIVIGAIPSIPKMRTWSATPRAGTSDNFSGATRTQLQSLTFTGPAGTYQVSARISISTATGAQAGYMFVTAGGFDIVNAARADTNSTQRLQMAAVASYVHGGGSLTVSSAYQVAAANIGTVWNGPSTALDVFYLGP